MLSLRAPCCICTPCPVHSLLATDSASMYHLHPLFFTYVLALSTVCALSVRRTDCSVYVYCTCFFLLSFIFTRGGTTMCKYNNTTVVTARGATCVVSELGPKSDLRTPNGDRPLINTPGNPAPRVAKVRRGALYSFSEQKRFIYLLHIDGRAWLGPAIAHGSRVSQVQPLSLVLRPSV